MSVATLAGLSYRAGDGVIVRLDDRDTRRLLAATLDGRVHGLAVDGVMVAYAADDAEALDALVELRDLTAHADEVAARLLGRVEDLDRLAESIGAWAERLDEARGLVAGGSIAEDADVADLLGAIVSCVDDLRGDCYATVGGDLAELQRDLKSEVEAVRELVPTSDR
jgi:hypothetical protein